MTEDERRDEQPTPDHVGATMRDALARLGDHQATIAGALSGLEAPLGNYAAVEARIQDMLSDLSNSPLRDLAINAPVEVDLTSYKTPELMNLEALYEVQSNVEALNEAVGSRLDLMLGVLRKQAEILQAYVELFRAEQQAARDLARAEHLSDRDLARRAIVVAVAGVLIGTVGAVSAAATLIYLVLSGG